MGKRWVRMTVSISGGGPNGREWDQYPAGSLIELEDWEAADHLRGYRAVVVPPEELPLPEPPKAPALPDPPPALPDPPAASPVLDDSLEGPKPTDPKQAWVDHAVAQGEDPDKATAMTKADLQSRYGGRL